MHNFLYTSYKFVSFVTPISGKMMNLYTVHLTSHIPIQLKVCYMECAEVCDGK